MADSTAKEQWEERLERLEQTQEEQRPLLRLLAKWTAYLMASATAKNPTDDGDRAELARQAERLAAVPVANQDPRGADDDGATV